MGRTAWTGSGCGNTRRAFPPRSTPRAIASLVALFDESFRLYAARGACVCMGKTITYAELDAASRALAAWLQARGLPHGARVAVMMPNVLQNPVAIAAILRAGMTVVNVNPLYKPRELELQLSDSGAEAIVVLENFASVLQEALPHTKVKHVVVASMGDMLGGLKGTIVNFVVRRVKKMVPAYALPNSISFNDALAAGGKLPFNAPTIGPDDIAFLQYTGGTTGVAKGAMLLHRNMVANRPAGGGVERADASIAPPRDRAADRADRAAALSHLRAHRLFPVRRAQRRHVHADSQSARHRRPDQGAHEIPRSTFSRP